MYDEHAVAMRHPDPDRLAGAGRQQLGPRERPRAQLVQIEIAVRELEELRTELVLVAVGVLLDEPVVVEGAKEPVHRALREAESVGELADAEPSGAAREGTEDASGSIDGLNHRDSIVEWCSTL